MSIISRICVFMVHRTFKTRFWLAKQTRKHPAFAKVVLKIGFEGDYMDVLPKNSTVHKTVELNIEIENASDRNVVPSDLVKDVLRRTSKIFIMNFCLCRQSNGCKDYPVEKGCLFIGEGTEKIPSSYGHFASADEACELIDECGRLGMVHIIGRNKIDKIWMHTGKNAKFLTICNCCPCCCLWNMARDIHGGIVSSYKRFEGTTVELLTDKCIGCGICIERCFVRAISVINGKCTIDDAKCRGCGRCSEECPTEAIRIHFDPTNLRSEADKLLSLIGEN